MSYPFKICDPVHGFIRFGEIEKRVIDSRPFQRLRYIHQLAIAYLVYPGATHTRFEHSLGVMDLVTRIYNTLIEPHNQIVPLDKSVEEIDYWRLILRLAALCHDMGHLPFSHTAEKALLGSGGHEEMTLKIISCSELKQIWSSVGAQAEEDIAKLCIAQSDSSLSAWEQVLAKIITEDSFGGDRIDYLMRDGYYTGVGYGHLDYRQLIDSLRALPVDNTLRLGITISGMQSVESLWIARYMMFARVYQHPKVRIYTSHMRRFMSHFYQQIVTQNCEQYLEHTDYTLLTALAQAAKKGDYDAQCLLKEQSPFCEVKLPKISVELINKIQQTFGEAVFIDELPQKEISAAFPVYTEDQKVMSCFEVSPFLREIPAGGKPLCVYVHPAEEDKLKNWLKDHF